MPRVALALYVLFVAVAMLGRMWLQYRRTGDHGVRGFSDRPGSLAWFGGILFGAGMILALVAPLAGTARYLQPWRAADTFASHLTGLACALVGFAVTIAAQLQMRDSWRIGLAESERTVLVRGGLYTLVRNPIYTGVLLLAAGLVGMVPHALSAAAFVCSWLGVEIQVRRVEEPYLIRTHGEAYLAYARAVGRFLPGIGRMRA